MDLRARSFQENVSRMPWWLAAAGVSAITLLFALVYFLLNMYSPSNGVASSDLNERIVFLTCIYFSVVTESTLGDGVLSPHGAARAVVGIQVLFGLVIAGILVAKIVSAPSATAARIARMAQGDWVDCLVADGKRVLGRASLHAGANGLCFQGTDYRADGTRGAAFVSHILALNGDKVSFTFQSFDFTREVFTGGVTTLSFSDARDGQFTKYAIRIRDSSGVTADGWGFRVEWSGMEEQLRDPDNCSREAIAALGDRFEQELQL